MKVRSLYPVALVPLLAVMLLVILLRIYAFPSTHAAPFTGRVTLSNNLNTTVSKSRVVSQVASNQTIALAIGLSLRNQTDLTSYLQQVAQPQSALYHHYLNASSFSAQYGPLPASEKLVSAYLQSQGFTITKTYSHHMLIDVVGTVAQVEKTFQLHENMYQSSSGQLFTSNDVAPSLPANIAPLISSVTGLDSSIHYGHSPLRAGTAHIKLGTGVLKPNATSITNSANTTQLCPQAGSPSYPTSYTPQQIATAYDFTPLYDAGNMGEGQTVGLLELDGFSSSDIATYTACFGGKNTLISTIPIDGYSGVAGPNASEVELDMEMVLGLAPHLASLRVYEASNTSLTAYNDAWARIISDDTPVVSTSWVYCEQGSGSIASEIQQESQFFLAAAAQGQTILAASGDLGANGCYNTQSGTNATPTVDDPASQPFVTGVGGTTLHINFDNTYASEQVWNDRAISNGASGGGLSRIWYRPRWQQGPGVANAYSTGNREVPDVAMNADPQTGYDVYCSIGGCNGKGWQPIGGTSAAAPVWAALTALANEASIKANGYLMGFLNPSLYSINYGSPGTTYATAFHDVVPQTGSLNNNDYVGTSGTYPDSQMYDMATGLGSFDAYHLTQNLITLSKASAPRTTATNTTWYFAEGRVGGDFQEFLTLENPDPMQTAQVQVQYLLQGGTGPTIIHKVLPQSRSTVSVNADLGIPYAGKIQPLSMIVTSLNGVGIVAERPMYFSWNGISSGTDVLGATTLGQDFYFADVEAVRNYSSFITVLNPPGGQNANLTVSYYAGGVEVAQSTLVVPAGQRGTMTPPPGVRTAAVHVHSDQPVVVERPTYFTTSRSNISGPVTGAMSVIGAPAPNTDWLFAEGYTGSNFHEYLVLGNFDSATTANVTIKLEYSNGAVDPVTVTVAPQSQTFFDVNAATTAFAQSTAELSAEVTSDAPIVAQRIEYFRFNGNIPGGTDVMGEAGPAKTNYSFAEGYTTNGFSEFLTLQNPNATPENVAVTLYLSNSISTQRIVSVGAQTRVTISINSLVVPIAQGNAAAGYEVSLSVQAITGTVVAERPMYFDYHNVSPGGTDVVGYTGS